ncbi:MAG TPA: DUF1800 domain-containing protein, partial [Burkholderiales bacterium]|nr:DUF1800 domain-containing protein [Burkholderiales bacterium]
MRIPGRLLCHLFDIRSSGLVVLALTACVSTGPGGTHDVQSAHTADPTALLNRITWGANASSAREMTALRPERYLERQLHPATPAVLPNEVQAHIDAMTISQRSVEDIGRDLAQRRVAFSALTDVEQRKAAQKEYQQELVRLGREASRRMLLRALYSPNQLEEQMTWFWMNHFNVFQFKGPVRALIGDYEEHAIRPHALGRFRDLLAATARHPAMLFYLDNARNANGHINENYARELMELHTMGVNGGYTQRDVQELARILTGFGINVSSNIPRMRPGLQDQYVRVGLFEFNPNRHDYGDKVFLGRTVQGRGPAELDEALDRLARHPATAHFVSRKLAVYFVADDPPPALVERMTQTYQRTDGDI